MYVVSGVSDIDVVFLPHGGHIPGMMLCTNVLIAGETLWGNSFFWGETDTGYRGRQKVG